MPKLLLFVEKNQPILREIMPEITDFTDPSLQQIIQDMCYSILPEQLKRARGAHKNAAGMAANQWGIRRRIFIFTPEGSKPEQPLDVMINPNYVPHLHPEETQAQLVGAYEGCFSVPLTTGIVNRYQSIVATYHTAAGDKVQRILEGWEARVFQHETDHLNGKLFDGILDNYPGPDCKERIVFKDAKEMEAFWQEKVKASREK
jgi:peptide deformylase